MEKELIETKGLFYKIKSFFSKIFAKNKNIFSLKDITRIEHEKKKEMRLLLLGQNSSFC